LRLQDAFDFQAFVAKALPSPVAVVGTPVPLTVTDLQPIAVHPYVTSPFFRPISVFVSRVTDWRIWVVLTKQNRDCGVSAIAPSMVRGRLKLPCNSIAHYKTEALPAGRLLASDDVFTCYPVKSVWFYLFCMEAGVISIIGTQRA
jgi:hypothetical protein